jgi:hypothetical protein
MRIETIRLYWLRKISKSVIPRARFARGICFFLRMAEKQIPRFARDYIKLLFSAASLAASLFEIEPQHGQNSQG